MRDGWVVTSLEHVADVIMGQSPDGKTYNQDGVGLPFMQGSAEFGEHYPRPEKWCSEPKKIAEPGDLLLSVRAPVGDTNFANQRIAVGRGLSVIRSNSKSITEFIRLVIQENVSKMIASSGTGMFASITGKNLKEFEVNLPPLSEQKRIVDLISAIDTYIEALQHQLETAKKSRNAALHELLTADGDGWIETKIGEIAKPAGGCAFPDAYQGKTEGIPFIKVSDMNSQGNEKFILVANHYVSKEVIKELGLRVWEKGTVVFPKVGAALLTEKRRILTRPTIFDNNIMGLVANAKVDPGFLYLLMLTINFSDHVQPGAVPSIKNSIVEEINIRIPSLPEQYRIVEMITTMDEATNKVGFAINGAKNLRSALLSDLLSGDHEIPASYDKVLDVA
jgi:type I restriction enzyme, S subunit